MLKILSLYKSVTRFKILKLFWHLLRKSSPGLASTQSQSGVALPLVVVTIVLATTIVVGATYSSYISGRLNATLEQGLRAEYLVKSALNLARVLIQADTTPEDTAEDPWRPFEYGQKIPSEILNIDEKNVTVDLEISPLSARLPLDCLLQDAPGNTTTWLDNFVKLFQLLDFENDNEAENSGPFAGKIFSPEDMVANLYDYMDSNLKSFEMQGFKGVGIEDQLPSGTFKNKKILRESELAVIPGFTPSRLQRLLPYIVAGVPCTININSASPTVLKALHKDITETEVESIVDFRKSNNGPFKDRNQVSTFISPDAYQFINTYLDFNSKRFSVLAKAQFSANTTFLRARVKNDGTKGSIPEITLLELY